MSRVLFLGVPSHGHINPTIGLVQELVKQGEEVWYFAAEPFKHKIEKTGAIYKAYAADMDMFKIKPGGAPAGGMFTAIQHADVVIAGVLQEIEGVKFDYIIHSAAFPFTTIFKQLLGIPAVSSLAVYLGLNNFFEALKNTGGSQPMQFMKNPAIAEKYNEIAQHISAKYNVQMPVNMLQLMLNVSDINLVYSSKYFAGNEPYFDDSYKFVGPPVADRQEDAGFPFEKLEGKKVIYISLGTVFSNYSVQLYDVFFKAFADADVVVAMAAYNVDTTQFTIPSNFIVQHYIPQSAVLKYASAAITHAGMNSISDLIYSNVPFVCLPMGADQPALAKRAEELGATIALDVNALTPEALSAAVEKVMEDGSYAANIEKINESFNQAGGYPKAVQEIWRLKTEKGII